MNKMSKNKSSSLKDIKKTPAGFNLSVTYTAAVKVYL